MSRLTNFWSKPTRSREAGRRFLKMEHYDVQLFAGVALHFGQIAVMQTGEGKTLTATLPLYLAAIRGKGAHLVTANDYLAQRDAELMRPLYEGLGLTVAAVTSDSSTRSRSSAYRSDITYTTAKEIGFDFLRDRLIHRQRQLGLVNRIASLTESADSTNDTVVHRDLHYVLIDEADNILIDEARTPLVVSSAGPEGDEDRVPLFAWAARIVSEFEPDQHFTVDAAHHSVALTSAGRQLTRRLANIPELAPFATMELYDQMELAIIVDRFYVLDRHYIVRDGEVIIVDEFTGRLAEGRKWRAGLHQAIEAREGVTITGETQEAARITIQDLFLKYEQIAGMTGTIGNSSVELETIYQTPVLEIPTHRPPQRKQWPDLVFAHQQDKWQAIVEEVVRLHAEGRPVLIGTRSIDASEHLSRLLDEQGIEHYVLNAKEHQREAEIVAAAGQFRKVTVATNMAGRGTDIQLAPEVHELGGLHVICSELHESARIDRQLIGRCGRQGDPGTFRQFMSLEDDLLRRGIEPEQWKKLKATRARSSEQLARYARVFRQAQRHIENKNFQGRKILMYQEGLRHEMQTEMGLDPYLDAPSS
ncbi:MAG: helicase-related protein [Pirellulaceae bacterium]